MQYSVKKVYDVWTVIDEYGNEVEECPTKSDALKFAREYSTGRMSLADAEYELYSETIEADHH